MTTAFPSLEDFVSWLESVPADQVVGTQWGCSTCPIATYLKDGVGYPAAYILGGGTYTTNLEAEGDLPLPSWAREFIHRIDRVRPRHVTAEDCLEVIKLPYFDPSAWENGKTRQSIGTAHPFA